MYNKKTKTYRHRNVPLRKKKTNKFNLNKTKLFYHRLNKIIKNRKTINLGEHILLKTMIIDITHQFIKGINLNKTKYSINKLLNKLAEGITKGIPYDHIGALKLKQTHKTLRFLDNYIITGYSHLY
jgi:hypothetical protein